MKPDLFCFLSGDLQNCLVEYVLLLRETCYGDYSYCQVTVSLKAIIQWAILGYQRTEAKLMLPALEFQDTELNLTLEELRYSISSHCTTKEWVFPDSKRYADYQAQLKNIYWTIAMPKNGKKDKKTKS